jgi:hypothetical protein
MIRFARMVKSLHPPSQSFAAVVKIEKTENHPSGAKARHFLSTIYGTAEALPLSKHDFHRRLFTLPPRRSS